MLPSPVLRLISCWLVLLLAIPKCDMGRSRCLGFWLSSESACRVVPCGVVFDEGPGAEEKEAKRGRVCSEWMALLNLCLYLNSQ
jgi:hypothetical protein